MNEKIPGVFPEGISKESLVESRKESERDLGKRSGIFKSSHKS